MTKSCLYCGSQIPVSASVCSECKYHQNRWRNNFLFAAGLAGLIGLFGSGVTFTIGTSLQLYKSLTWRDRVTVLQLHSIGNFTELVIANSGDGPIFVTDIEIAYREVSNVHVQKSLAPNEISAIQTGMPPNLPESKVFSNKTGLLPPDLFTSLTRDEEDFGKHSCFMTTYYSVDNNDLTMMIRFYSEGTAKLVTQPAKGHVKYFSPHSGKQIDETLTLVATFLISDSTGCAYKFQAEPQ